MKFLWITLPILFFGYVGQVEANNEVYCLVCGLEPLVCRVGMAKRRRNLKYLKKLDF